MRPVKFKKYVPVQYDKSQRVKGTGMFEEGYSRKGMFHKWGVSYEEFETNAGNSTVAIIELEDGTVETALPHNIKFDDKWTKPTW